jgi:hypothetical protein
MARLIIPESQKIVVTRPDGRPEVYDVPSGVTFHCEQSALEGKPSAYQKGQVVMVNPLDSEDGKEHFIHVSYLPDDVVIYDPETNQCRNKDGTKTWVE